jgi:hypothetical protein
MREVRGFEALCVADWHIADLSSLDVPPDFVKLVCLRGTEDL